METNDATYVDSPDNEAIGNNNRQVNPMSNDVYQGKLNLTNTNVL